MWSEGPVTLDQSNGSKGLSHLIRPLDHAKIFTVVSGGCFPYGSNGIATRWRAGLVVPDSVTAQKRLNFWPDRWISPEFLQEFLQAIFLVVVIESLLCEAKVRSRQTRVTAQKGSNFRSDRWIVLKFLQ